MSRTFFSLPPLERPDLPGPAIKSYMMGGTRRRRSICSTGNGDGTNLPAENGRGNTCGGPCAKQDRHRQHRLSTLSGRDRAISPMSPLPVLRHRPAKPINIAAWKSSYRGVQKMGSADKTLHSSPRAGISPASSIRPRRRNTATHQSRSSTCRPTTGARPRSTGRAPWWPRWQAWLAPRSGAMVPARPPGDSEHEPLAPAPGTYVLVTRGH